MKNKTHKRLLKYTSAAGISAFALSNAAEAQIIQLNPSPGAFSINSGRPSENFDINGDGNNDIQFAIRNVLQNPLDPTSPIIGQSAVINDIGPSISFDSDPSYYLNPFNAGEIVNGNLSPQVADNGIVARDTTGFNFDAFTDWVGQDNFHAFSFEAAGETHFAWLEVSVTNNNGDLTLTISDGAYNSVAGESITVGAIPEPSTYALGLGLLAAGAAGIRTRRRMKKTKMES